MDETTSSTETAPPLDAEPKDESTPPLRSPLVRSAEHRIIGGVADGLAAAWGWKPWIVRAGFVAATALAGLGIVLYAAGWLFIPLEGEPHSIAQGIVASMNLRRSWVGFGLLVLGALIVGSIANIDGGVLIAGALLATGYMLYRGDLGLLAPPAPPPPPPDDSGGEAVAPRGPVYVRAARPPRPKSYLGRLTVGVMMLVLGIMGALDALGVARPTSRHYAAAAVLVIGLGLLVGTVAGRSRGLIALGLLLMPVLAVAAIADYRFGTTWEYVTIRPQTVAELESGYRIGSGNLTLDLRNVDFSGETLHLDLHSGIGNVYVDVPADVAIEATATATLGQVGIEGRRASGFGAAVSSALDGTDGTLIIDASVRMGSVEIYRSQGFEGIDPVAVQELLGASPGITTVPGSRLDIDGLRLLRPARVDEIAGTYEVLGGQLILDLGDIRGSARTVVPIVIEGSGQATAIVPERAYVYAASDYPFYPDGNEAPDEFGRYFYERPGAGTTFVIDARGVELTIREG